MRTVIAAAAAAIAFAASSASAQQPEAATQQAAARAVDEAYVERCVAKVSKELCGCVVAVANAQIEDPVERSVFFDYMMGDVEKAKAQRAIFPDQKKIRFNVALQKAETMLGERCDKLRQPASGQPAAAPKPQ